ncbi:MAG: DUF3450 domain-containing protein [Fibrobacter sp.]|nr:DUF3450 domain-containing protein [Fibrobacter sp.]
MIRILFFFLVLLLSGLEAGAEQGSVDEEIARVKKELAKIESERSKVKKERAKDKAEFDSYQSRTARKISALKGQIDSTENQIKALSSVRDSLESRLLSVNTGMKQQELLQKRLREKLLLSCNDLLAESERLPPLASEQVRGSIIYLRSEITSGSIDNTEALHRFVRIAHDMKILSREVQVAEGISPVKQISGTVYRLRVGCVFEAVVDSRGEKAFYREENEWKPVEDPAVAASLLKAVKIREGKTVPVLVNLPFASVKEKEVVNAK